jgi:hypothetical protein
MTRPPVARKTIAPIPIPTSSTATTERTAPHLSDRHSRKQVPSPTRLWKKAEMDSSSPFRARYANLISNEVVLKACWGKWEGRLTSTGVGRRRMAKACDQPLGDQEAARGGRHPKQH